jgi:hypothetical protein
MNDQPLTEAPSYGTEVWISGNPPHDMLRYYGYGPCDEDVALREGRLFWTEEAALRAGPHEFKGL